MAGESLKCSRLRGTGRTVSPPRPRAGEKAVGDPLIHPVKERAGRKSRPRRVGSAPSITQGRFRVRTGAGVFLGPAVMRQADRGQESQPPGVPQPGPHPLGRAGDVRHPGTGPVVAGQESDIAPVFRRPLEARERGRWALTVPPRRSHDVPTSTLPSSEDAPISKGCGWGDCESRSPSRSASEPSIPDPPWRSASLPPLRQRPIRSPRAFWLGTTTTAGTCPGASRRASGRTRTGSG